MQPRPSIAYKKNDRESKASRQIFRPPPSDHEVTAWACKVLQTLDGLTHAEIRHVLREADVLLNNATVLDCSSSEIRQVFEEYVSGCHP